MASRAATFRGGYLGALLAPLRYAAYLVILLVTLLLAAWVIDAILVFRVWNGRTDRLQGALAEAVAALRAPYGIQLIKANGPAWANGLYQALFVASAIEQIVTADEQGLSSFDQAVQRFFVSMLPVLHVLMLATKLVALRLALWLSAILPVAMGYAVGMVDGLVERLARRYGGGRESATLYHRAKYAMTAVVGAWLFAYACVPMRVDLGLGAWAVSAIIAVLSRLQWKYYKKYV